MVFLAQMIPFSASSIISIAISIGFSAATVWLSAQLVTGSASLKGALIFSVLAYIVLYFLVFIPIPSIPFVSLTILIEVLLKSLFAMKFFNTDFRKGISIAGVQTLFGFMLIIPYF
ncbi:MAG: hypothetical protein ABIE55_02455 [Candidatus Aenigmatarchaeota archaeon]